MHYICANLTDKLIPIITNKTKGNRNTSNMAAM